MSNQNRKGARPTAVSVHALVGLQEFALRTRAGVTLHRMTLADLLDLGDTINAIRESGSKQFRNPTPITARFDCDAGDESEPT